MITWELALVIFAITYMVVNFTVLFIQLKTLNRMEGLFTKSCKFVEKMIDKSDKYMDDLFKDDLFEDDLK